MTRINWPLIIWWIVLLAFSVAVLWLFAWLLSIGLAGLSEAVHG